MTLAPSGIPLSFVASFDADDLDVGLAVYDNSTGTPTLVGSIAAMTFFAAHSYAARFTGKAGKSYLVTKAVYTDGTLVTLDPAYPVQSGSFVCQNLQNSDGQLVGVVSPDDPVIGQVNCS